MWLDHQRWMLIWGLNRSFFCSQKMRGRARGEDLTVFIYSNATDSILFPPMWRLVLNAGTWESSHSHQAHLHLRSLSSQEKLCAQTPSEWLRIETVVTVELRCCGQWMVNQWTGSRSSFIVMQHMQLLIINKVQLFLFNCIWLMLNVLLCIVIFFLYETLDIFKDNYLKADLSINNTTTKQYCYNEKIK